MSHPADLTLVEAAARVAARDLSSRELTEACLERAQACTARTGAFLEIEAAGARAAADRADAALARGEPVGPLHGVPLAHKDMFYREGLVCSCGTPIRAGWRPATTATVILRLRAAGAIELGRLAMAEWAKGPTGHNDHFGHVRNPWNPAHVPGGSSAGSGAAVAARAVFGALGSDTGGSIRIPSALCGVVGLKPTYGRVSRHAAMPLSFTLDTIGPLTRTVRDAARLTAVIAGHDPLDGTSARRPVPDWEAGLDRPVRGLRLGVALDCDVARGIDPAIRTALETAATTFAGLGVELVPVTLPPLEPLGALHTLVLKSEEMRLHADWLRTRPDDYSIQVRSRIEGGFLVPADIYLRALAARGPTLRAFVATAFARCDALLAPMLPMTAPTVEASDVRDPAQVPGLLAALSRCSRPFNWLGLPALSVPCGFVGGLPVAMQLIARPFDEATVLRLGHAWQGATAWHERAPPS